MNEPFTLKVREHGGRLDASVGNARTQWSERRGFIVSLSDGEFAGLGECAPLPGYSRETFDEARAMLSGSTKMLTMETFARLRNQCEDVPSLRFALETAWIDLHTQRSGHTLGSWLAPILRDRPSNALFDLARPVEEALALVRDGYRTLKVKVGRRDVPFEWELQKLVALRKTVGNEIALRLDANGAWDLSTAECNLRALAPLNLEFVEEPVSGVAMLELDAGGVPWAIDESLLDPVFEGRVPPGCSVVVLKPALLGGIPRALTIAHTARLQGAASVVTHLFDGPIGLAAACELARALPDPLLACGLTPHAGLGAWPAVTVSQLRSGTHVTAPEYAGLGFSPADRARLTP